MSGEMQHDNDNNNGNNSLFADVCADRDTLSVICAILDMHSRAQFDRVCKQWHQAACRAIAWDALRFWTWKPRSKQLAQLVHMLTSRAMCPSGLTGLCLSLVDAAGLQSVFSLTGLVTLEMRDIKGEHLAVLQSGLPHLQQLQDISFIITKSECRPEKHNALCFPPLPKLGRAFLCGFHAVDGLDNLPLLTELTLLETQTPPKAWPPSLQLLYVRLLPGCEQNSAAFSSSICNISSLTTLHVSFVFHLSDTSKLSSLTWLVTDRNVSNDTLLRISSLPHLRILSLQNPGYRVSTPTTGFNVLQTLSSSLVDLRLFNESIRHNDLLFLRSLVNLEALEITGMHMDNFLDHLCTLKNLRKLRIDLPNGAKGIDALLSCKNMQELVIASNGADNGTSFDTYSRVIAQMKLLQKLAIRVECAQSALAHITDTGFRDICSLVHLKELEIYNSAEHYVSSDALFALRSLIKLESLFLSCVGQFDHLLLHVVYCPRLTELGVNSKAMPNKQQEQAIRKKLPRLGYIMDM